MVGDRPEDLGLKFGGTRAFHRVSLSTFARLQERLGVSGFNLIECVVATIERTVDEWPRYANLLTGNQALQDAIDRSIQARRKTLMRGYSA
jgi:serine/threonine-protein kinase HipA